MLPLLTYKTRSTGTPAYLASLLESHRTGRALRSSNNNLLTCMHLSCRHGKGHFGGVWLIVKHGILGLVKRVSFAEADGPILTICMSYDVFLRMELPLGPFGDRDHCICVS